MLTTEVTEGDEATERVGSGGVPACVLVVATVARTSGSALRSFEPRISRMARIDRPTN